MSLTNVLPAFPSVHVYMLSCFSCVQLFEYMDLSSRLPENAVDQDKSTAWVEGASGAGIGQSITFYLSGESRISGFQIYGGYQKNEDIYYKNCRPKEIRVTLSDGSSYDYFLEDSMTMQTVTFPYEIKSSSLTITILSVYPGNKYEDLAISDIKLF